MDSIERQKLLVCQALEELHELWEERQKDKNEIKSLQKKIDQQREDIHKMAVEKEKQCISIKHMKSQLLTQNENDSKASTAQNKNSENSLMGGHQIMLVQLKHLINKTQEVFREASQETEQVHKILENIKQEIQENKKYITQQKFLTKHMKLKINENVKKIKKRCTDIQMQKPVFPELQSRQKRERKGSFDNLKKKLQALLEETNRLCLIQEKQEQQKLIKTGKNELNAETIQMQKQDTQDNLPSVQLDKCEIKRAKDQIKREKEDILRDRQVVAAEMEAIKYEKEDIKKERVKLVDQYDKTKNKIREMEVLSIEIDGKKSELTRMIKMSRRKKDENCEICETKNARQVMEVKLRSERQQSSHKSIQVILGDRLDTDKWCFNGAEMRGQEETLVVRANLETSTNSKETSTMHRVAHEVEELRKMLTRVRENTERRKTSVSSEENKTNSELTQQDDQAKPIKVEKVFPRKWENMPQERRMIEKNVQQTEQVIQEIRDINIYIQKVVTEISKTKESIFRTQRMMKEEKVMVRKYLVSKIYMYIFFYYYYCSHYHFLMHR